MELHKVTCNGKSLHVTVKSVGDWCIGLKDCACVDVSKVILTVELDVHAPRIILAVESGGIQKMASVRNESSTHGSTMM